MTKRRSRNETRYEVISSYQARAPREIVLDSEKSFKAVAGKLLIGKLPTREEQHAEICEDGPNDCLMCAQVALDREIKQRVEDWRLQRQMFSKIPPKPKPWPWR